MNRPRPVPLPVRLRGEERLEDVLQHVGGHAAAGVGERPSRPSARDCTGVIVSTPPSSMLSRALTTRLSTTCLMSWALTGGDRRWPSARKMIFLPRQLLQVLRHLEHALDQLGQIGRLAAALRRRG